jgi:hypothetical protein
MKTTSSHIRTAIPILLLALPAAVSAAQPATLVVCAPGYPGSTAEAKPAMDALAAATAAAAGWGVDELAAQYLETEAAGLDRLARPDAAFALLTMPFFLEHRRELELTPIAQAVPVGRSASEPWSLVAGAGRVKGPEDLAGWELVSLAGHSPRFVRGPALGDWGELPPSLTITFSGAVLSALRKAAGGDNVVVLLDADQAAALPRLPFADRLETVHISPPLPVSVLCSVGHKVSPERADTLANAMRGLDTQPNATEALDGVRIQRFVAVDHDALTRAVASFEGR